MTNSIITRVVWCDDISQLLIRGWLRFAVVLLPQLVHHGNYTVEPFGHAGPHPVLKGRNAPLVVRFLLITCFPGCNCNKKKQTVQAAQGVFSDDFGAQNNMERLFWLYVQKVDRKLPFGWSDITDKMFGWFPAFLSVPELHLLMSLMLLHCVCVYICDNLRACVL